MRTVYYDGKCGLCRREIEHYKKIQPPGVFEWVDLTENPDALQAHNISPADALMYLHVKDENEKLHVGLPAFLVIWRGLGGFWRVLVYVVGSPGVRHVAGWVYKHFAYWRFNRLTHCQAAPKEIKK